MSTRQLIVFIAAVSVLAAGLAWWLQRFELDSLHADVRKYLANIDKFKAWEADNGGS